MEKKFEKTDSLIWADIEFDSSGTPFAKTYDDVYFSRAGGLDETNYVFLKGNNLPARWQNGADFTIIETGFGTGLNFLATVLAFQKVAQKGQRLTFISTEKHPIQPETLAYILKDMPAISPLLDAYLKTYPEIIKGKKIEVFSNIYLHILIGDIKETLPKFKGTADAWFLDGFSPSKNPDMWSEELFTSIQNLSAKGTTAATFTAARLVKDGLTHAGFTIEKTKGYAFKRHRIIATR